MEDGKALFNSTDFSKGYGGEQHDKD